MLQKFRNQSVRGRLIRLVAVIVVPLSIVCSYLAYRNLSVMGAGVEAAHTRVVEDFAFRTRLWFRSFLRAGEAFVSAAPTTSSADGWKQLCGPPSQRLVESLDAFEAIVVLGKDDASCVATRASNGLNEIYLAESRRQLAMAGLESWGSPVPYEFRYSATVAASLAYGVIQLRQADADGKMQSVTLFVALQKLDDLFDAGEAETPATVGLLHAPSERILAIRGRVDNGSDWLPALTKIEGTTSGLVARARDGRKFVYGSRMVAPPDLLVVAAFSNDNIWMSQLQLGILAVAPLLLLVVFMVAYWRLVDRDVGRSIERIESVASIASKGEFHAAVPVDDDMPLELRRASEAVNQIVASASQRQDELKEAAARYENLMRELHHRVKNSLQVIQSYLAITRRQASNRDIGALHEAEVKVQVLSVAYRYALTHLGLRSVPVRPFLSEILGNIEGQSRRSGKIISASLNSSASLEVDRIIPLGLALTEVVFTALRLVNTERVDVTLYDDASGLLRISVATIGDAGKVVVNERTIQALKGQMDATAEPLAPNEILRWVLSPAPTDP